MLYQLGLLDDVRVEVIIDSNANYQGKRIFGIPVGAPEELRAHPQLPVIVSSQNAQEPIRRQITEQMHLPNPVVTLY